CHPTRLPSSLAAPQGLQHQVPRLLLRVRRTASRRASHPESLPQTESHGVPPPPVGGCLPEAPCPVPALGGAPPRTAPHACSPSSSALDEAQIGHRSPLHSSCSLSLLPGRVGFAISTRSTDDPPSALSLSKPRYH